MPPERDQVSRSDGLTQRQHILRTALTLMAQQGVDGTSMRTLATATGLNVASLYHYFPSKRDLLVAVLEEQGFVENLPTAAPTALSRAPATDLADLVNDILASMLDVEDFIRLMLGEVMRGDETATTVGSELFEATQESLQHWLEEHDPPLCAPGAEPAMARLLRSLVVGLFVEHVAGLLDDGGDAAGAFRVRADEVAEFLDRVRPAGPGPA